MRSVVIFPLDGFKGWGELSQKVRDMLSSADVRGLLSHLKVNDAVHGHGGSDVLGSLRNMILESGSSAGLFLDLKLADTNGTDKNTLAWYVDNLRVGDIVTVRDSCSAKAFRDLRQILPEGVKIALVSMLTDTSVDECRRKYGMFPWVKILNDATNIQAEYEEQGFGKDGSKPFDAIVCSPLELEKLKLNFPDMEFIVPGIRDVWMTAGQQARFTGVAEALIKGATYVVMGSQLSKGNPKEGVSTKESVQMTVEEIKKALA